MLINDLTLDESIKDTAALKRLKEIRLPTKKTEEFRQFDISPVFSKEFSLKKPQVKFSDELNEQLSPDFYTIFVLSGEFDLENSVLPESVKCSKKEKASHQSQNALYHLSEAYTEQQNEISIEADLEKPLMIVNVYEGDKVFAPVSQNIIVKENCRADVLELNICKALSDSFVNANKSFLLKENASLIYTKLQSSAANNTFISNIEPKLSENATCSIISIDLDSGTSLNIVDSTLVCEHTSFSFEGIVKLSGENLSGNIISIVHDAKFSQSNMICKHLLDDESQALFEVKSTVNHDAKFSKTFQNSQTILLKNGARINANPKLILHTDELEAAHGATSGSLDEEALYYMQSRGIDMQKAEQMLINAIELEIIDKISDKSIRELALSFIED